MSNEIQMSLCENIVSENLIKKEIKKIETKRVEEQLSFDFVTDTPQKTVMNTTIIQLAFC